MLFGSSPFKFLHRTLRGIKSFVSVCGCGNYQKLPKHSPLPPKCQEVINRWDPGHANARSGETPAPSSHSDIQTHNRADCGRRRTAGGGGSGGSNGDPSSHKGSGRSFLVSRKLKELEVLDVGNIQHVLDVEEAIHYYSLLKCPVYRAIADDFFAEIYAELCRDSTAAGAR
ncbi:hypothetical protein MLD38_014359 [Melastoma candidum]|uniref:Uncharacterized protein n=1 Tax=Melastoma candidum TaxID=119954 RepID=A0ACB9RC63_9MYRT|nr:hypothetical protein MLD38_014359 [Melastoma candidum]